MAREWLIASIESAYGTIKTTPTINTEYLACRLTGGSSFTARKKPIIKEFMAADTLNRRAFAHSERYAAAGRFQTLAYATHIPLLMKWASQLINAGQTAPWTTTERPNDLGSMTFDHALEDPTAGTVTKTRYSGGKCTGWTLAFDNESDVGVFSADVLFKSVGAHTQTEPADSDYPSDVYCFQDLTTIMLGATTTNIRSLNFKGANMVKGHFDESTTLSYARLRGRTIDFDARLLYKISVDRRTAFNALTAYDNRFVFNNGTNTLTLDFFDNNFIADMDNPTPLDNEFEEVLTIHGQYDSATDDGDFLASFT